MNYTYPYIISMQIPVLTCTDFDKEATSIQGIIIIMMLSSSPFVFDEGESPQTRLLCERLGIENPWKLKAVGGGDGGLRKGVTSLSLPPPIHTAVSNPDEILINDDDDDDDNKRSKTEEGGILTSAFLGVSNPDEISISDDDGHDGVEATQNEEENETH